MPSRGLLERLGLTGQGAPPQMSRTLTATLFAVGLSLGAGAGLVALGTSLWPGISGYTHFRFGDYATLTVIGVLAACASWPLVCRAGSHPRRFFLRLAVVVSVILLLPDVWLLARGEPVRAVAVLVAMHLVIAVATYQSLVRLAPPRPAVPATASQTASGQAATPAPPLTTSERWIWAGLCGLAIVTDLLGIWAIVAVPIGRPDQWLPSQGQDIYAAHAAAGGLLGLGAAVLLISVLRADRIRAYSAAAGLAAAGIGALGGILSVYSSVRYDGMGLMLAGGLTVPFAFLAPGALLGADDQATAQGAVSVGPVMAATQPSLYCATCGPLAATGESVAAREARMDDSISARRCPFCPGRGLEAYRDVWICWCCESVYRRGSDTTEAWVIQPGKGLVRTLHNGQGHTAAAP